jgi:hypothetical protein
MGPRGWEARRCADGRVLLHAALAPVRRSGRFGCDGRDGVSPEPAAELARLLREALSHLTQTALSGRG